MNYILTKNKLQYKIGNNIYNHFGKYFNPESNHKSFLNLAKQIDDSIKDSIPKYSFIEFDLRDAESSPQGTIRVKTKTGLGKNTIDIVCEAIQLNIENSPAFSKEDDGFYADALCGSGFLNDKIDCLLIEKGYIEYNEYLNSKEWIDKRNEALKISDYKCAKCGVKESLHVHHLNYDNVLNESQGDLLVVCNKCHNDIHNVC